MLFFDVDPLHELICDTWLNLITTCDKFDIFHSKQLIVEIEFDPASSRGTISLWDKKRSKSASLIPRKKASQCVPLAIPNLQSLLAASAWLRLCSNTSRTASARNSGE